jgi:hypothetical protein
VATDSAGNVVTSTNPTGGAAAWTVAGVGNILSGVSCPSSSLCVATDATGAVITSTNPTGGALTWTAASADPGNGLSAVSCPSSVLCVATDSAGNVVTSTNPTGGAAAWTVASADPGKVISAVSCHSATLCVATDLGGNVVTSTNPTGGAAAWTVANADPGEQFPYLLSVSCPSSTLCVAGTVLGNVLTSTNPTGGAATWTLAHVAGINGLINISCPSASFCAAVDYTGDVVTSTNPTGGAAAWTVTHVDGGHAIPGISCPSASFCAAVDDAGNVLTSTNPTGGAGAWTVTNVDADRPMLSVSCPSSNLCVAVDYGANVVTSTNPTGGAGAWTVTNVESGTGADLILSVSCPSASFCAAVDYNGNAITSTDPTGGAAAWTVTNVSFNGTMLGVSCPSADLCVATQVDGIIWTSTNPTGGADAWSATSRLGGSGILHGVSCPSASLCVAVSDAGSVVTSTDPAGGADAWTVTNVDDIPMFGISCPTSALCVGVDLVGNAVRGTPATPHSLTASEAGNGTGSVSSSAAGINCPGTCSHSYGAGSPVTLTATPAAGSRFAGWSGGGCSGTDTCQVTLDADTSVTATFTKTQTLSVTEAGVGSGGVSSSPSGVDCPATCSQDFDKGTVVTLTATPDPGDPSTPGSESTFTGWSGGGCSGTGTCVVTMDADASITATFDSEIPAQETLSIIKDEDGGTGTVTSSPAGIDCGATCEADYVHNTPVTLTAVAGSHSAFTGWSGHCTGTGTCQVTMDQARYVTATFAAPEYMLTVTRDGSGSGSVSDGGGLTCPTTCSLSYGDGSMLTLTATAGSGSSFTGWSGGGCSGTSTCDVTMDQARAVTATFAAGDPVNLTLQKAGGGSGTVTSQPAGVSCGPACPSQVAAFQRHTAVTLTALAAPDNRFTGWSCPGTASGATCDTTLHNAVTATANFVSDPGVVLLPFHVVNQRGTPQHAFYSTPSLALAATRHTDAQGNATLAVHPGDVLHFTRNRHVGSPPNSNVPPEGADGFAYTVPNPASASVTITLPNVHAAYHPELSAGERWIVGKLNQDRAALSPPAPPLKISTTLNSAADVMARDEAVFSRFPDPQFWVANQDWGWPGDPYADGYTIADAPVADPAVVLAHWDGSNHSDPESAPIFHALSDPSLTLVGIGDGGGAWNIEAMYGCPDTSPAGVAACGITTDTGDPSINPAQQTLSITKSEAGGVGTVTSSPAGINCGATCTSDYAPNTPVTLTAVAGANSAFSGWSGDCTGTGTCQVTMGQARSVTATFVAIGDPVNLTVQKAGAGQGTVISQPAGVSCGPACPSQVTAFQRDTAVTLTATASPGNLFTGWSCPGTAAGATCDATLHSAVTATASFVSDPGGVDPGGGGATAGVAASGSGAAAPSDSSTGAKKCKPRKHRKCPKKKKHR